MINKAILIKNAEGNMCSKDATNRNNIIPLEFSLNTESSWIYCNYPEQITSSTGIFVGWGGKTTKYHHRVT